MNDLVRANERQGEVGERMIYSRDPLARLLLDRLGLSQAAMALLGLAWGVLYVVVLPGVFGGQRSADGYLGSFDDWHAQLLLFLVFPAACAFYVWQPRALSSVYQAMHLRWSLLEVGRGYRSRCWPFLPLSMAAGIVIFDLPKMVSVYGGWWMTQNWLTILGREASLALAFYMLSMMAGRQFVAAMEWRRLLVSPAAATGLRAASTYGLSWSFLLALLALRLSIEGIELPHRVGGITPDYYAKVAIYVVGSVGWFLVPLWGGLRRRGRIPLDNLMVGLELAGIVSLPLLGFIALKLIFGP
ncbi:MAG: hypothetical protein OEV76_04005 [Anaerolineae bacterium]|nr:hypothetical protein [Anaerolineae bacterium]